MRSSLLLRLLLATTLLASIAAPALAQEGAAEREETAKPCVKAAKSQTTTTTTERCAKSQAPKPETERAGALKTCAARRKANPTAFAKSFGKGNRAAALRRCAKRLTAEAKKREGAAEAEGAEVRAVLKACLAERKADAAAFLEAYGEQDARRAIIRCVAQELSDQLDSGEQPEARAPDSEAGGSAQADEVLEDEQSGLDDFDDEPVSDDATD